MQDISENIFKAIDIITEKRLLNLKFDKTITATITDTSNAENGIYLVSDESTDSSEFTAYSANVNYKTGTSVYVNIPNGDFEQQKFIVGKVVSDETEYFAKMSPLDQYVDITGNLFDRLDGPFSLLANNPRKDDFYQKDVIVLMDKDISNGKLFSKLALSASFKNRLRQFEASNGTYGLKVILTTEVMPSVDAKEPIKNIHELVLDINDMYGNPYAYESYYSQDRVFDLDMVNGTITNIKLLFFQDCDFVDRTNNPIPYMGENGDMFLDNIFVDSISVNLGYDINDYDKDTVLLYTFDAETYNNEKSVQLNHKTLHCRWIRVTDEEIYSVDSLNELPPDTEIYWYSYKIENQEQVDPLAGYFWHEIPNSRNKMMVEVDPETTEPNQQYLVIIKNPASQETAYSLYKSNILEFRSEVPVVDKMTADLITGLKIEVDVEGYGGNYFLYNTFNEIQNSNEANKKRILRAVYKSLITGVESFDDVEDITWKFPLKHTMIHKPEVDKEYEDDDHTLCSEDENYFYIRRDKNAVKKDATGKTLGSAVDVSAEQKFRIKDYYMESATNNIITCIVTKNNIAYETSCELIFGPMGTNGTDYTFTMKFDSDIVGLTAGDTEPVKINLGLYDYNNDAILNFAKNGVKLSWYSSEDHETEKDGKTEKRKKVIFCDDTGKELENLTIKEDSFYIKLIDASFIPNYYIIQASLNTDVTGNSGEVDLGNTILNTFLPVPFKASNAYLGIEGTTKIFYNSSGTSPEYYKEPYQLIATDGTVPDSWTVNYIDNGDGGDPSAFYPKMEIKKVKDEDGTETLVHTNKLVVPSTYIKEISPQINVTAKLKDKILWIQPIMIGIDQYSSAMLNSWDGELTIDEKNGTILSTMIGAGIKNSNNTFSGVLMGDVKESGLSGVSKLGLYGFHEGEQSFGWKIDGTGFIGKSGRGQILFDGNHGRIQSLSYDKDKTGMMIDLDDGFIDIRGADKVVKEEDELNPTYTMNGSHIKLSSVDPYFVIKNADEKVEDEDGNESDNILESTTLMHVGNKKYFLQSANYSQTDRTGIRFDLGQGKITGYEFKIMAGNSPKPLKNEDGTDKIDDDGNIVYDAKALNIIIDSSAPSTGYPFRVGDNFRVKWDGSIEAANGKFTGHIESTDGNIGGLIIDDKGVKTSDNKLRIGSDGIILLGAQANIQLNGSDGGVRFATTYAQNMYIAGTISNGKMSDKYCVEPDNTTWYIDIAGNAHFSSITGPLNATNITATGSIKVNNSSVSLEGHTHDYSSITNKPTTFPPATHTHNATDITYATMNISQALSNAQSGISSLWTAIGEIKTAIGMQ